MPSKKKILFVGLLCYDAVHVVPSYPLEDSDQRSQDQYGSPGGNACNNTRVLTELGEPCQLFGTLAEGALETLKMEELLNREGIDIEKCVKVGGGMTCPNSMIILNSSNGSRTIIHTNRDLRELQVQDMVANLDLEDYEWIHFEGRNLKNVKLMIEHVRKAAPNLKVSVEVEKVGRRHEELIPLGDVVVVGKDVSASHGAKNKNVALEVFRPQMAKRQNSLLVCPWGEDGAAILDVDTGTVYESKSFPPEDGVVDTIAAGDCFNATLFSCLIKGLAVQEALTVACKVAGAKVGRRGFKGLKSVYLETLSRYQK